MGLITKEVEVVLNPNNIKHFESLNYEIPRKRNKWRSMTIPKGTKLLIKVEDLLNGSNVKVDVECDNCGKKLNDIIWCDYKKQVKDDNKYYCQKCAAGLYAVKNGLKTRLKNGKSFEQWCIDNEKEDILNRWDYELNNCLPSEITYGTGKKYYFKCLRGIHKSELKNIVYFTNRHNKTMDCKQCKSIAQWGIDNLGSDFLDRYWDFEKNKIDPFKINKNINKKVWIKCQEKDYHESYDIACFCFIIGQRCGYCHGNKVHPLDSLGILYPQVLNIWSDKNKKSPYEYAPSSIEKVWWKCQNDKHKDYKRSIKNSNLCDFRCPKCQFYKGEKKIEDYLYNKNIIFKSQYSLDDLLSDKGKLLRFDFGILNKDKKIKGLIEFDGIQHFEWIKNWMTKEKFKRIQIHDQLKDNYCINNSITLLRIPYWEFDNIEQILSDWLTKHNLIKK